MQRIKTRNFCDLIFFQKIGNRKAGIHIIREMEIISLSSLVLAEVLYTVAILLNKPLRRCPYLCRYIHFAQNYNFYLIK